MSDGSGVRWRGRSRLVRDWRLARTWNPQTSVQKVRCEILRDHRPLIVTFTDRAAVRGLASSTPTS